MLDQATLKQELHYCPDTGAFTRKRTGGGVRAGAPAGGRDAHGHMTVSVFGKRYRAARLAFLYITGAWPQEDVDHINGDRADDRWSNLRAATRVQNLANTRARSGMKGACWVSSKNRWKAQIRAGGKNRHIGYFDTEAEANAAYAAAAQEAHGEFARA